MPRYYELDVICEVFSDILHISERDIEEILENAPTEDVVPRSEVESLQNELAIMRNGINEYKVKLEQAKQEVAREMFEDFTKHKVCTNEEDYRVLAELNKKHIGE